MRRVLALHLPHLAADLLPVAGQGASPGVPRVLVRTLANRRVVTGADAAARALGIAAGLTLTDARARVPDLIALPDDPPATAACLARLADWATRYTPHVALDGPPSDGGTEPEPDGLALDLTGCAHLWGDPTPGGAGEAALLADLAARLARRGLTAGLALAGTRGAAWGLARYAPGLIPLPAGVEAASLAPLPVAALRLPPELCDRLRGVGLRRVADLLPIPRAALTKRFGPLVTARLDQALGRADDPLSPRPAPLRHEVRLHVPEGLATAEGLAEGLARLATRLCRGLEAVGAGARRVEIVGFRLDGAVERQAVGLARPSRSARHLTRLLRPRVERIDPGPGIETLLLRGLVVEPLAAQPGRGLVAPDPVAGGGLAPRRRGEGTVPAERGDGQGLGLGRADSSPDTGPAPWPKVRPKPRPSAPRTPGPAAEGDLAELVDRLAARLGARRVVCLWPRASHRPERCVRPGSPTEPIPGPAAPGGGWWPAGAARPLRLLVRPEPVEAVALTPDSPPRLLRRADGASHRFPEDGPGAGRAGPERIGPEWWRLDDAGRPEGDHYRLEDTAGRRLWVVRDGPYGGAAAPGWRLLGWFA